MKSLLLICLLAAAPAFGVTYNYSYTFGTGRVLSGSVEGTANGNLVENISNVSVFFNGLEMPGTTVYTAMVTPGGWVSGGILSFDGTANNFLFSDADYAGGDAGFTSYFYMVPAIFAQVPAYSDSIPLELGGHGETPVLSRWSLSAVGASVPEAGSTVAMLGLALAGLVCLRRKR